MTTTTTIDPAGLARILAAAGECKLGASTLQILCRLRATGIHAGSLTMTSAARALGVSTATITGLADNLEALGFARRRRSFADRRAIWLEITPAGIAALEDILES